MQTYLQHYRDRVAEIQTNISTIEKQVNTLLQYTMCILYGFSAATLYMYQHIVIRALFLLMPCSFCSCQLREREQMVLLKRLARCKCSLVCTYMYMYYIHMHDIVHVHVHVLVVNCTMYVHVHVDNVHLQ